MNAARRDESDVADVAVRPLTSVPTTGAAPEGHEELPGLLRRAADGDLDAAAAVFEATVHDAWRIALLSGGSAERATAVLEAAYQRVWAEAGDHGASVSGEVVPAPLTRSWVLALVHRVACERAALAPSA